MFIQIATEFTQEQIENLIKQVNEASSSGADMLWIIGASIISCLTTVIITLYADKKKQEKITQAALKDHIDAQERYMKDYKELAQKDIESRLSLQQAIENNTEAVKAYPQIAHDKIKLALGDLKLRRGNDDGN